MNKDAIRKMFNAKFKYVVRVIFQRMETLYSTKHDEITHIFIERHNIHDRKVFINNAYEEICYCKKDVEEHIKWLKSLNAFNKPQIIGL